MNWVSKIDIKCKEKLYKVAYNNGYRDGYIAGMRKIEKIVNRITSRKPNKD